MKNKEADGCLPHPVGPSLHNFLTNRINNSNAKI